MGQLTFIVHTPTQVDQTIVLDVPSSLGEGVRATTLSARLYLPRADAGMVEDHTDGTYAVDAQVVAREVDPTPDFDPAQYGPFDMQDKVLASLTTMAIWPDGVEEEWSDDQVARARIAALNDAHEDHGYFKDITFRSLTEQDKHVWAARALHETAAFHNRPFEDRDWMLEVGFDGVEGEFAVLLPFAVNGVHSGALHVTHASVGRCHGVLQ